MSSRRPASRRVQLAPNEPRPLPRPGLGGSFPRRVWAGAPTRATQTRGGRRRWPGPPRRSQGRAERCARRAGPVPSRLLSEPRPSRSTDIVPSRGHPYRRWLPGMAAPLRPTSNPLRDRQRFRVARRKPPALGVRSTKVERATTRERQDPRRVPRAGYQSGSSARIAGRVSISRGGSPRSSAAPTGQEDLRVGSEGALPARSPASRDGRHSTRRRGRSRLGRSESGQRPCPEPQ